MKNSLEKIELPYGKGALTISLPEATVVAPKEEPALLDQQSAFRNAIRNPIGARSLPDQIGSKDRVCIVFTDISRPTPNHLIIPWLLEELAIDPARITLLNALGSHEPNTTDELKKMLTPAVVERYRIVNHDAVGPDSLVDCGTTSRGTPVWVNRHLVESEIRINTGFIEPHFFAGFSGGPKGFVPGVAGLQTIQANHCPKHLLDSRATFGITHGNPLWEDLFEAANRIGDSFLINVTLNRQKELTGIFAGDISKAHETGIASVRELSMVPIAERFDVVITTNSGYPLDQNLYQVVKGICAACEMVKPGGDIIMAAACERGVPEGSPFDRQLRAISDWGTEIKRLSQLKEAELESWQVLKFGWCLQKARVWLKSELPDDVVRSVHLKPSASIEKTIELIAKEKGTPIKVGVLPLGPLTVPYLKK